jgi:hypothetical protein
MTLSGVLSLFREAPVSIVNAAWFHYLAFDLFVGSTIMSESIQVRIHHL